MSAEHYPHTTSRPAITNPKIKPRKLREACDNCHLAKVKCTKSRPTCDRCLAAGTSCTYSPSARMGKPRQRATTDQPKATTAPVAYMRSASLSAANHLDLGLDLSSGLKWLNGPEMDSFGLLHDPKFQSFLAERDNVFNSWDLLLDHDHGLITPIEDAARADLTDLRSPIDFLSTPAEGGLNNSPAESCPSLSLSATDTSAHTTWPSSILSDDFQQLLGSKAPSPRTYPTPASTQHSLESNPLLSRCNCSSLCLQTMQNLVSHCESTSPLPSSSPFQSSSPLDFALSVNKEAIAHCSAMLDCDSCLTSHDGTTTVMLLAILLGKIISFYRSAYCTHLSAPVDTRTEPGALHMSFGAYQIQSKPTRRLDMEILLTELRMVEMTYNKFKETCNILRQTHQHASGVYDAMIVYLAQELNTTILTTTSNIVD